MSSGKKVIVIGSGAIGLSCAYFLWKQGHEVIVLERFKKNDNSGCSFGNAGLLVPSHIIPLAAPGLIWQGIKWMANPKSPFSIHPRLNLSLLSWLWKFYQASSAKRVQRAAPVLRDLSLASRELFIELASEKDFDFGLQQQGLLMLCQSEKTLAEESHLCRLANQLGIEASILNENEIQQMQSPADVNVLGGVYFPTDAHLVPEQFMQQVTQFLESRGVFFHYQSAVEQFNQENSRLISVQTKSHTYKADEFVLATGAWSEKIMKQIPAKLPMQPGKGYSVTLAQPNVQLKIPSILCEARVAVTPMGDQLRFTGTMQIGGMDLKVRQKKIEGMKNSITKYLPNYKSEQLDTLTPWAGLRPCSPDGLPYIGRLAKMP